MTEGRPGLPPRGEIRKNANLEREKPSEEWKEGGRDENFSEMLRTSARYLRRLDRDERIADHSSRAMLYIGVLIIKFAGLFAVLFEEDMKTLLLTSL